MPAPHVPVLLQEVLRGLNPRPGQHFADGTVGGGGHAAAILEATAPSGRLLALDRDPAAITLARENLKRFGERVTFINDTYRNLQEHVERIEFPQLAGVLLDLGFSSAQLADRSRGFSYQAEGPLDLRYDPRTGQTAADILQTASQDELERIFREYGEDPAARRLARAIVDVRRVSPFRTTADLLQVIGRVKGGTRRSLHPATLVWQALRLAVNQEMAELSQGLAAALQVLEVGGRLAVISFHSGEDRAVKRFFRRAAKGCVCPPEFPVCRCGRQASLREVTKRPIVASATERQANPRARSAKLRLAERLAPANSST